MLFDTWGCQPLGGHGGIHAASSCFLLLLWAQMQGKNFHQTSCLTSLQWESWKLTAVHAKNYQKCFYFTIKISAIPREVWHYFKDFSGSDIILMAIHPMFPHHSVTRLRLATLWTTSEFSYCNCTTTCHEWIINRIYLGDCVGVLRKTYVCWEKNTLTLKFHEKSSPWKCEKRLFVSSLWEQIFFKKMD